MLTTVFSRFVASSVSALFLSIVTVHAPLPAHAEEPGGTLTFQWDNDKVADTDRHYTSGIRIGYTHENPQGQLRKAGRALAELSRFTHAESLRVGWVLGQNMYTPEDVNAYVPDPTDRPYAGWSYVGLNAQNERGDVQDTVELDMGIIGPASMAAQAQNAFHRLINVSVSRGWRHQIHNEPGVLLARTVKRRAHTLDVWDGEGGSEGIDADVVGHASTHLGNVQTSAAVGGTMRLGANLTEDFGPTYGNFAPPAKRPTRPVYQAYLGGEARAVLWDVFLDGNTFRNSPDVDKKSYVLETRLGIGVHWPLTGRVAEALGITGLRTNLELVQRTREFETQEKADRYGSLQVMVNF